MSFSGPSLRDRLRAGTRAAQDALDRAQRRVDLTGTAGLRGFLMAQRDALTALHGAAPELRDGLAPALRDLTADLADLGVEAPPTVPPAPRIDDARGRGYVWHSQRLALRMLARKIPESETLPRRFLTAPRDAQAWRALCDDLETMPGYGPEGDAALAAANDWLARIESMHLERERSAP